MNKLEQKTSSKFISNETGYFSGEGDRRLFYQAWKIPEPQGIMFITHGLSENSDRYDRLARHIIGENQCNVYAWDLRGHGRSSGLRGYVRDFQIYEKDLVCFLDFILPKEKNVPFILFGHSLGGLIISRSLFHEEDIVSSAAGICLTSPAFGLSLSISLIKMIMSHATKILCPWWTYHNKIISSYLSRDPYFLNVIDTDVFRHNKVCPEVYLTIKNTPKTLLTSSQKINSKLLILLGGDDVIIDNLAVKKYFDLVQSILPKKLVVYPKSKHQILEDYGNKKVMKDFNFFIQSIVSKKVNPLLMDQKIKNIL